MLTNWVRFYRMSSRGLLMAFEIVKCSSVKMKQGVTLGRRSCSAWSAVRHAVQGDVLRGDVQIAQHQVLGKGIVISVLFDGFGINTMAQSRSDGVLHLSQVLPSLLTFVRALSSPSCLLQPLRVTHNLHLYEIVT